MWGNSRIHGSDIANAAMLNHQCDDYFDLLHHCNVFVFIFSVSSLPSFKEHLFQGIHFSGCVVPRNLNNHKYVQFLIAWRKMHGFIVFFQVVSVMVKDEKFSIKRYNANKNYFCALHEVSGIILPVVLNFEESEFSS